jgi:hypothetical protein
MLATAGRLVPTRAPRHAPRVTVSSALCRRGPVRQLIGRDVASAEWDALRVVDRSLFPASPRPDFDSGAAETVGHGVGIETMRLGDRGERSAPGVRVGGCRERVIVPLLGDIAALHMATVEVGHHRGSADAELFGKLHDRGAGVVTVDEIVDLCGAKSGLRTMPRCWWGSRGVESGWLPVDRLRLGV